MGIISFIKEAGEKLFGDKEIDAAAASATTDSAKANLAQLNTGAAKAIATYIDMQKLGLTGLVVTFDGASRTATLRGTAPTQEASEKAALCCGNVTGVTSVDNQLAVTEAAAESKFHDVVRGDTLSAIAKTYYGNAGKYLAIFEANKPMLSDPDKIYQGQKLRIPALA